MPNYQASLLVGLLVSLGAGCEKTPGPPPEAAVSPAEPTASPPATTPVATPEPSAPPPTPESAPPEPPAPSVASAAPTPSPSAGPPKETAHKAAVVAPKPVPPPAESTPAPPGSPAPDDACQTKNFHYSQVASACKSGGRKSAKVVMKGALAKAKAAGTDLKCSSCHADMKDFHLKSNAVADLKNWL